MNIYPKYYSTPLLCSGFIFITDFLSHKLELIFSLIWKRLPFNCISAKQVFFITAIISFPKNALVQTYTSMNGGDWDNTTNVWSTNGGSSACSCSPNSTVDGFDVHISHDITMTDDIDIDGGGSITISDTASLIGTSEKFNIENGSLISYGTLVGNELEVKQDGLAYFYGSATFDGKFLIEGFFLSASSLSLLNASIEVKSNGSGSIESGCEINLPNGNLYNEGTLIFNTACIEIINGNFENKSGGVLSGIGSVHTLNGNIYNDGSWSGVHWCASGGSSSMPFPANCNSNACSTIVLSNDLINWDLSYIGNKVEISIDIPLLNNVSSYTIDKSLNIIDFETVDVFSAQGGAPFTHIAVDSEVYSQTTYYRLQKTNYNGTTSIISMKSIYIDPTNIEALIYPNPCTENDNIQVMCMSDLKVKTIEVYNSLGKIVHSENILACNSNSNNYDINTFKLGKGKYTVVLSTADRFTISQTALIVK